MVVMQHPVTTEFDKARGHIQETLEAVYELKIPTFWFWPNPDAGTDGISKGIRVFRERKKDSNIHFFHNMEPLDFLRIIKNSRCLVGNSSAGIRECAFLGVPVVNIGSRQNGRLRSSNVIDCDYNKEKIMAGIIDRTNCPKLESSFLYGDGMSGVKTAEILTRIKLKSEKKICY
jgi:UDP-N-acetylglucosamine 2-epimerase